MTINLNFYVFIFYLSLFVLSLLLSGFVYLVDLGGAALGRVIVETIPHDYMTSCDDYSTGQLERNAAGEATVASQKDVTPNSPSEPKRPKEGSVAATWHWLRDSVSNLSLKVSKDAVIRVSENNLVHRNDAVVKNTMQELVSDGAVPAKTLNFTEVRYPWGYGVVEEDNGKITAYAIADLQTAKTSYDERILSANVKPAYSTLENLGIKLSLATNKLGEPQAIPLPPARAALVVEDMGYKTDQLSDFQRQITDPPLKSITDSTNYSPPVSPTSARKTHNPF